MPVESEYGTYDLSPLLRRYEAEYLRKGCTPRKAGELARKKARRRGPVPDPERARHMQQHLRRIR